jgi:hypothetical protein
MFNHCKEPLTLPLPVNGARNELGGCGWAASALLPSPLGEGVVRSMTDEGESVAELRVSPSPDLLRRPPSPKGEGKQEKLDNQNIFLL